METKGVIGMIISIYSGYIGKSGKTWGATIMGFRV